MSKSSPITITSEELRERVEEYLDRWIPDDVWNRSEPYARRKLDLCREREPEVELLQQRVPRTAGSGHRQRDGVQRLHPRGLRREDGSQSYELRGEKQWQQ